MNTQLMFDSAADTTLRRILALVKTLPESAVAEVQADLKRLRVMSGRPGRCAA